MTTNETQKPKSNPDDVSCLILVNTPERLVIHVRMRNNDQTIFQHCAGRAFHVYIQVTWYMDYRPAFLEEIKKCGGTYTILANTPEELEFYLGKGEDSFFCNQNVFIDWNLYFPTGADKEYDFVINSALIPYKNHNLLVSTQRRFAMISQSSRNVIPPPTQPAYHNTEFLNEHEVNSILGKSRIGVTLSTVEGSCHASTEYLLAGLPVVSTFATGGRMLYYNDTNSLICEADPCAVRDAIEDALSRTWDAVAIRRDCVTYMQAGRHRFIEHFAHLVGWSFEQAETQFVNRYRNRLWKWYRTVQELVPEIHAHDVSELVA